MLGAKVAGTAVTEATLSNPKFNTTPLMAFTKLKKLTLIGRVDLRVDVSPLKFLPLEELTCPEPLAQKNAPILKGMKTLKTINKRPAAVFWKAMDAKKNSQKPAGKTPVGWQRTIDDGDDGYSEVSREGSVGWQSSHDAETTKQAYGGDCRYNDKGAATARWTFSDLPHGRYEAFATWPAQPNRAGQAAYIVYDGKKPNQRHLVDQRKPPDDLRTAGFEWESLGKYDITGGTLVVELDATTSNGTTVIADAVRIVRIK